MIVPRALLCATVLPVVFVSALQAGEPPRPGEKVPRMFRVPPDMISNSEHHRDAPAEAPVDPFAVPDSEPSGLAPERTPRYPHVIPTLGREPPLDARPMLEGLGIAFGKGDVALVSAEQRNILFVMSSQEQVDLVETIVDQACMFDPVSEAHLTYLVRQTGAQGRAKDLLERTVIVRGGQRVSFQRQREGQQVENAEMEAIVIEGSTMIDVNLDLEMQFKDLKVHAGGQVFVRDGDPAPVVIYTGAGRAPQSKLEVLVSGKVRRDDFSADYKIPVMEEADWQKLAKAAAAEVIAAQNSPQAAAATLRSEAVAVNLGDLGKGNAAVEVKLPDGRSVQFAEVTEAFGKLLPFKLEEGRAWYCPTERMLFLHAGEKVIDAAHGMAGRQWLTGPDQYELKLSATETKGGKERSLPPRTLLIRAGYRAKGTSELPAGLQETEAELEVGWARSIADVNLKMTGAVLGSETWTFNCQAIAFTDGKQPVTLVSGRAADSGGGFKRLQATVDHRGDRWRELLSNPLRRAEAVKALHAALVKK